MYGPFDAIVSILIFVLLLLNTRIFFHNTKSSAFVPKLIGVPDDSGGYAVNFLDYNTTSDDGFDGEYIKYKRHIPPKIEDINFTESELNEAIKGLNLPVWSRSYRNCSDEGSEVSCSQIIKAWRCLHSWEVYVNEQPFDKRRHFLMKHLYDGIGNRFSTDTTTFIFALMNNRSYVVDSEYPTESGPRKGQAFKFNKHVLLSDNPKYVKYRNATKDIRVIDTFDPWYSYNFYGDFFKHDIITVDRLLYATMMYTNSQTYEFSVKHFGMHAAYFICNFLTKIPGPAIENAKKIVSSVPADVRVFGVHLRLQFPGQFYSHSVERTMEVVIPFLKSKRREMPTIFAFASDSKDMEVEFLKHFKDCTIQTDVTRVADFDHDSAIYDIALLEMADELLLTYRSTFSYVCAMRTGKRAWFVEKESSNVFISSNSQSTAISTLYHQFDHNDWQLNRRVRHTRSNEKALRYYMKYFLV